MLRSYKDTDRGDCPTPAGNIFMYKQIRTHKL